MHSQRRCGRRISKRWRGRSDEWRGKRQQQRQQRQPRPRRPPLSPTPPIGGEQPPRFTSTGRSELQRQLNNCHNYTVSVFASLRPCLTLWAPGLACPSWPLLLSRTNSFALARASHLAPSLFTLWDRIPTRTYIALFLKLHANLSARELGTAGGAICKRAVSSLSCGLCLNELNLVNVGEDVTVASGSRWMNGCRQSKKCHEDSERPRRKCAWPANEERKVTHDEKNQERRRGGAARMHAHAAEKEQKVKERQKKEEEEKWGWKKTARRPWTDDGRRREGHGRVASASFAQREEALRSRLVVADHTAFEC